MSTGNLKLDILLNEIKESAGAYSSPPHEIISKIQKEFHGISEKDAMNIYKLTAGALDDLHKEKSTLVITAPPSFSIRARSTDSTVSSMISKARESIIITGYSLSSYFDNMMDCIIQKSQEGVLVRFFANDIEKQPQYEKLKRYKGQFLRLYNYKNKDDAMAALHAKVISVDAKETLITSANLSYHGQQGNIEFGILVESAKIAKQIDDVFTKLLFQKMFAEI